VTVPWTNDDKVVLHFSGGKDSLACLWLYRDRWDEITVLWCNTGAAYPETVAYMRKIDSLVPYFDEVRSDQPAYIAANGWPVDILPMRASPVGRLIHGDDGQKFTGYMACCAENIWQPLAARTRELGATVVLRGQKLADQRKAPVRSGFIEDGIRYVFPLEDWTDEMVFEYLERERAPIPDYYRNGEVSSHDCADCSAYLDENITRLANLPPERRVVVFERLATIRAAARREMKLLDEAIERISD
jgi:phosphoadenosine phosphosulfate reductase